VDCQFYIHCVPLLIAVTMQKSWENLRGLKSVMRAEDQLCSFFYSTVKYLLRERSTERHGVIGC